MNWDLALLNLPIRKKSNIIVGVIYRHPSTDLTDVNCYYLNFWRISLIKKISKSQLIQDFKINLLNYNKENQTN